MAQAIQPAEIFRFGAPVEEHSYIVKLKPGTHKQNHLDHVTTNFRLLDGLSDPTHVEWNSECFHGYAGNFSNASLEALRLNPDVEYIEENVIVNKMAVVHQEDAPWGLCRISHKLHCIGDADDYTYYYKHDDSGGEGVDVYVLDTGIYTDHSEFEGRASWGKTTYGKHGVDTDGHGTHCAGTIAGKRWGVAKKAHVIAVKVIGDDGYGTAASVNSGMLWVRDRVRETMRPSILSISLGGGYSKTENEIIESLTDHGIHVVVAAGNENVDAKDSSPASAPTAVTIGACNISQERADFSNFGPCVNFFAPGEDIISCGISGPKSTAIMSGTSMACPHVAGLVAYLIPRYGNLIPSKMVEKMNEIGVKRRLSNIPDGTVNIIARNDISPQMD